MYEIQNKNVLSTNEAVARSKLEGIPITETALRRWIKDGTLKVAYSGKKALIYWPNLVRLLCGEPVQSNDQTQQEVAPCSLLSAHSVVNRVNCTKQQ